MKGPELSPDPSHYLPMENVLHDGNQPTGRILPAFVEIPAAPNVRCDVACFSGATLTDHCTPASRHSAPRLRSLIAY